MKLEELIMTDRSEDYSDKNSEQSDAERLKELDAKLEAVAAVVEELLVNQQTIAQSLNPNEPRAPTLDTTNAGLYVTSDGTVEGLTKAFASRGTFTWFGKCCQKTCKIVAVPSPGPPPPPFPP